MRQTLFYIPHDIGGLPVFGYGWVLILWLLVSGGTLLRAWQRQTRAGDALSYLPMIVLVAAAIAYVLPRIEEPVPPGFLTLPPVAALQGLPIRGFGTTLLVAVVAGVGLAVWRASRAGLDPDLIVSLAFVMVLGGLVGARLLFVLQYWQEIRAATAWQTLVNIVSTVQGGLVVYGSLAGGLIAMWLFAWRHRLPILPLADLITPSLALGLAIGRLGCLLNGCCFGDVCQRDYPWAVTFPAGSPPYVRQQSLGLLHGMRVVDDGQGRAQIGWIDPRGPLADQGIQVGDRIVALHGQAIAGFRDAQQQLERGPGRLQMQLQSGRQVQLSLHPLPDRSLPVHPTQLYASFNAVVLCLLTLTFYPYRSRHGQTFALALSGYAVTRFLEEIIRTDEGAFWAGLSISQNLSLTLAAGMALLWWYIQRQPRLPAASV